MTENEKKRVKELWLGGMPIARIRQMLAIPVKQYRLGIAEMKSEGAFDNGRATIEQKICAEFDEGERNAKVIAEKYGVAIGTVRYYLCMNGRKFGRKTKNLNHCDRTLEIVADLEYGALSQSEIAKKHGVSRQYINKIVGKIEKGVFE